MSFLDALPDYGSQTQAQPAAQSGSSFLDQLPDYSGKSTETVAASPAQPRSQGLLESAAEPITSYPSTYNRMNQDARDQMSRGIGQIAEGVKFASSPTPGGQSDAAGLIPLAKGIGNTALGAVDYVASPINAALHTIVGKPVEDATGIPHQYSEFAASLALPGSGITKLSNAPETISNVSKIVPEVGTIKAAAQRGYDSIKDANVVIDPAHASALADRIEASLKAEGYRPVANNPGASVFSLVDELRKPQSGKTLVGPDLKVSQAATPADIEAVRKALNVAGKDPANRDAVRIANGAIDEFYKSLPESGAVISGDASGLASTAQTARANYAAAKKSETVTGVEDAADLRSAASHSGNNYDNAVRQRFATILNDPKMRRGFSPDELDQMEKIVRGNFVGNAARRAGNLLGGGGGLGQAVATGIGAQAAGPLGAAATALLGSGLKAIENASQASNVAKLDEMIRAAAPAQLDAASVARVKFAADKWARAQSLTNGNPTSLRLSQLESASRGLAVALQRNLGMDAQTMFGKLRELAPAQADSEGQ